jgi:hypothetical protein
MAQEPIPLDAENWRIIEHNDKYLLQVKRFDALKPYWLTQRIFAFAFSARKELRYILKTGRFTSGDEPFKTQ